MVRKVDPLSNGAPIVDEKGAPTRYFQQLWQQLFLSSGEVVTVQQAVNALFGRKINTVSPILGGGDLSADRTISHANSGVTAGTYGDATNVPQVTVDARGHVTGVANVPVSGGGGGGAVTLISQQVVAGSSVAIVTFSSIPATYKELILGFSARGATAAGSVKLRLRFNGVTTTTYDYDVSHRFGSSFDSAATFILLGDIPAATAPAGLFGVGEAAILDYANTTNAKGLVGTTYANLSGTTPLTQRVGGESRNTPAVTQIDLLCETGNIDVGSKFSLYGRG